MCIEEQYTYGLQIYCGAEKTKNSNNVPTSIVMELCKDLLDRRRTVYGDNNYTSIEFWIDKHSLLGL